VLRDPRADHRARAQRPRQRDRDRAHGAVTPGNAAHADHEHRRPASVPQRAGDLMPLTNLTKATLTDVSTSASEASIEVLFNPTACGMERGWVYASRPVRGLKPPILQYIRGEAQLLTMELFLDGSNLRTKVQDGLVFLRKFVEIDPNLHAPPVCRFDWG